MAQTLYSKRVLLPGGAIVPAAVTVDGATITDVAPGAPPKGGGAVDLGDALLTPAFVNAHTHLAMTAFRGVEGLARAEGGDIVSDLYFRLEAHMDAADVRAFVRMGAYDSLLCGVGLVWDHYYHGEAIAAGLADAGLAGVVAPTLQDLDGPGSGAWEAALRTTAAIDGDVPPPADELWRRAAGLARRLRLPLHFHLAQRIEEVRAVRARAGTTPVGLLHRLGVLDARPAGAALCHCPNAHSLFSFPAPALEWAREGPAPG
eukprot:gene29941-54192_t